MATKSFRTALSPQTQFWLADQKVPLGFVLAVLLAGVLAAAVFLPIGQTTRVIGSVERFGLTESQTGSGVVAIVRLPDREVSVLLPNATRCAVGDHIRINMQPRLWGPAYTTDWRGCSVGP
ncbi:hypothetical protein [Phenylobacterium montanum]|uniref:Uncharacterized protein n=1 Tax=Phenylobacterium montanum TaxID=2823693 RepID=A0A975IXF0_9CAUL|nr:hypothetical protein [Caulobacter sp. S6]QUD90569.1 hypothetical protein KCG34_12210 [Caulobacter sp. S6]